QMARRWAGGSLKKSPVMVSPPFQVSRGLVPPALPHRLERFAPHPLARCGGPACFRLSAVSLAVATWYHATRQKSSVVPCFLRIVQKRGPTLCAKCAWCHVLLYYIIYKNLGGIDMLTEKKAITDKRHLDKLDKIKI